MPLDMTGWERTTAAPLEQPTTPATTQQQNWWSRAATAAREIWTAVAGIRLMPPPKPVDARVKVLQATMVAVSKGNRTSVVDFIRQQKVSPAASYGALEAIHAVSRHPVHALRTSRYSCDMTCMSKWAVRSTLQKAIEHIEADPTRFVAS
jgi:hypothetical protein